MNLTDENVYAFKIHFILINEMKIVIQKSIENQILNTCQCKNDSNCCHVSKFLENKKKEIRKEQHGFFSNNLNDYDSTASIWIARNLILDNSKIGWDELDLDHMTDFSSYRSCLNIMRNVRNKYYGHIKEYKLSLIDYKKIILIFYKVIENIPNLEDSFRQKIKTNIDNIDKKLTIISDSIWNEFKNQFEKEYSMLEKIEGKIDNISQSIENVSRQISRLSSSKQDKVLRSDIINFNLEKNYIKRNEDEIINLISDFENSSINKIILCQAPGYGKSSMAYYISKILRDEKKFIMKNLSPDDIEGDCIKLLKEDFNYSNEELMNKNSQDILKWVYNELNECINGLKVIFVIDNVKNDNQIAMFLSNMPKEIKILITTRNRDLLVSHSNNQKKLFILELFDRKQATEYLNNTESLNKKYNHLDIISIVDKFFKTTTDRITPLKLKLIAGYMNSKKNKQEILNDINEKVTENEFIELIYKGLSDYTKDTKFIEFIGKISLIDNSFFSNETISIINQNQNENENFISILCENSIIEEIEKNNQHGFKIHDTIQNCLSKHNTIQVDQLIDSFNHEISISQNDIEKWKKIQQNLTHLEKLSRLEVNDAIKLIKLKENLAEYYFKSIFNFNKSIQYFEESLTIKEKIYERNHPDIAHSLYQIGLLYKDVSEYEISLKYLKDSLEINKRVPSHLDIAYCLYQIGLIYSYKKDYDESIKYLKDSENIAKNIDNNVLLYDIGGAFIWIEEEKKSKGSKKTSNRKSKK